MEIIILLLLTVPLSAATPLRPTHRSYADIVLSGDTVQASKLKRTENTPKQHLNLEALKHSMAVQTRQRPVAARGCQLASCQIHNLANTLDQIRKKQGTDMSKNASDPYGYGK